MGSTYIPRIVSSLLPLNGVDNCEGVFKPLLGVQVTELVDGFFIGCTANHTVIDGTSFCHFFNSWSEISRGLKTISKTPIFERWFPTNISKDNRLIPLPPLHQSPLHSFVPPPLLERVFHFSRESVAKLKAKANSETGSTDKISSFQPLIAHLWRSVTRCQNQLSIEKVNSQEVDLILLVGTRSRIPFQDVYFGNAVYIVTTAAKEAELLENGLGYAGQMVNELVGQQSSEVAIDLAEEWVKNPRIFNKVRFTFAVTSLPRHNVYGTDFGWGKPIAVRSGKGQKADGKMTFFPTREPGGIDVEVCLAPATLQAMEHDAKFMEAVIV